MKVTCPKCNETDLKLKKIGSFKFYVCNDCDFQWKHK